MRNSFFSFIFMFFFMFVSCGDSLVPSEFLDTERQSSICISEDTPEILNNGVDENCDGKDDELLFTSKLQSISIEPDCFTAPPIPYLIDLDEDGDIDIIAGCNNRLLYFENVLNQFVELAGSANPFYSLNEAHKFGTKWSDIAPAFTDLNGDGMMDFIIGNFYGEIQYYENEDNLQFREVGASPNPFSSFSSINLNYGIVPKFFDVNGDRIDDVVIGSNDGAIKYLEREGFTYTIKQWPLNPFNEVFVKGDSAPCFGDLDMDDKADLSVGGIEGTINVYEKNTTTGKYRLKDPDLNPFRSIALQKKAKPFTADIDNDGIIDLVVGEEIQETATGIPYKYYHFIHVFKGEIVLVNIQ